MSYLVVYEYNTKAGGYAGLRFIVSYENEAEFTKMNRAPNEQQIIVAKGVSYDDAQDLRSLNPEVCHLASAVHEMCYAGNGNIDTSLASYYLSKAEFAIRHDREHRQLFAIRKGSLRTDFPFVEIGDEETEKNRLYRFLKETFIDPVGYVGILDVAIMAIKLKITEIVLER